jgi:hypothetical protein
VMHQMQSPQQRQAVSEHVPDVIGIVHQQKTEDARRRWRVATNAAIRTAFPAPTMPQPKEWERALGVAPARWGC